MTGCERDPKGISAEQIRILKYTFEDTRIQENLHQSEVFSLLDTAVVQQQITTTELSNTVLGKLEM